jgi:hypothetical protein
MYRSLSDCLAEIKANRGKFYVYVLHRPDGTPFYVGCGAAYLGRRVQRIAMHEAEARDPVLMSHKFAVIRNIWRDGASVHYSIDSWHLSREPMIEREILLIAEYGRIQLGTGLLVNRTDGGDGGTGQRMDDAARRKMSEWRKGRTPSEKTNERRRQAMIPRKAEQSARQRDNWLNSEYRSRVQANMVGHIASTEAREKLSATSKSTWADPAIREKRTSAIRAVMNTPEWRAERSRIAKQLWNDPEFRARMKAARSK